MYRMKYCRTVCKQCIQGTYVTLENRNKIVHYLCKKYKALNNNLEITKQLKMHNYELSMYNSVHNTIL